MNNKSISLVNNEKHTNYQLKDHNEKQTTMTQQNTTIFDLVNYIFSNLHQEHELCRT